jgi:CheY-like chemotaxis protein
VLLVEDNELDIFIIREILSKCGREFDLRVARDGEDALVYLNSAIDHDKTPLLDLLLLDLNVPKVPGVDVLWQLRRGLGCTRVPVVVVTSSDSPADRRAVESLGVEAYFRKPTDLAAYFDLAGVIMEVLSGTD